MISDEKRREIAASLRESRGFISGLPKVSLEQNAFATFERILAGVDYERGNIFDYLADLIDRPTTSRSAKFRTRYGRETPVCEGCGYSIGDMRWNYCPKCGRVITE